MKAMLKNILKIICRLLMLPLAVIYWVTRLFLGERAFKGYSQGISLIPGFCGEYLRRAFYQWTIRKCSSNCCISFGTIFSTPDIEIEEGVYIGAYCILGHVRLEKHVLLASRVSIMSGRHQHPISDLSQPIQHQKGIYETVSIGEDSWIGEGAIIAASIGKQCVIAAGSVIFDPVEPLSIMKGNPALLVRKRESPPI